MSVSSMVAPKTVELIKVDENKQAYYKLRKNIIPTTVKNDLTNVNENIYVYDETEIQVSYVENQADIIIKDFDNYWTLGINQKKEKDEIKEKQEQIKALLDNNQFEQINLNYQNNIMLKNLSSTIISILDSLP